MENANGNDALLIASAVLTAGGLVALSVASPGVQVLALLVFCVGAALFARAGASALASWPKAFTRWVKTKARE